VRPLGDDPLPIVGAIAGAIILLWVLFAYIFPALNTATAPFRTTTSTEATFTLLGPPPIDWTTLAIFGIIVGVVIAIIVIWLVFFRKSDYSNGV